MKCADLCFYVKVNLCNVSIDLTVLPLRQSLDAIYCEFPVSYKTINFLYNLVFIVQSVLCILLSNLDITFNMSQIV